MGVRRSLYKTVVEKPERKEPFGRPGHRWEDDIRNDVRGVGWKGGDWIHLVQDRNQWRALVNTVMNVEFVEVGEFLD
jgi:hypothetical protein